ncbi:MAG TPA: endolytic transglycosylase MltG [Actinomycetota bacterium]|nr:endolytic transglycosylase MltG [Actinomycetota bacterium]
MLGEVPEASEEPTGRRRLRGLLVLLVVVALLGGALAGGAAWYAWATGASGPRRPVTLVVPEGATGDEVARLLEERGVIRSTFAFRLLARFRGFSRGFLAGKYTGLTTNMPVEEVLRVLGQGPDVESVRVTFPEGLTVRETAAVVAERLRIPRREFVRVAESGRFSLPPYLPAGTPTVEGFLFPNTYDFLQDVTAEDVVERLLAEFERQAAGLPWGRARRLGVTPYEVVVVASLVEEEARYGPDRPRIARVIYNRLRRGMLLQVDATIQYALGKKRITLADREVKSPYNTYLHPGLPPTPISSPGRASLEAALSPAPGRWLYYVLADCRTGAHAFAETLEEFNEARARAPDC